MGFFSVRFVGALFFGLVLFSKEAMAQSLEIIKAGDQDYFLKAVVPTGSRQVLQSSGNLQIWADLNDDISGVVSNRLEITGTSRFYRLIPWAPPPPPIRLVLLGDSTVADLETNGGLVYGWGNGMYGYFKPEATVLNFAAPCTSSQRFLTSESRDKMLAVKPDVVLVQFGLIDERSCEGAFMTDLALYAANLQTIVESIRGFNGLPILVTPPTWPEFAPDGTVDPGLVERAAVVKQVAAQLQVDVIDLHKLTVDLFNRLGLEGSAFIPVVPGNAHYTFKGAVFIAGMVVDALPAALSPYIKRPSSAP